MIIFILELFGCLMSHFSLEVETWNINRIEHIKRSTESYCEGNHLHYIFSFFLNKFESNYYWNFQLIIFIVIEVKFKWRQTNYAMIVFAKIYFHLLTSNFHYKYWECLQIPTIRSHIFNTSEWRIVKITQIWSSSY